MVRKFLTQVIGESPDQKDIYAIVFNISHIAQAKMMSIEACAFTRHAFDTFWRDFALVDTNGKAFIPEYTFRRTMENFHRTRSSPTDSPSSSSRLNGDTPTSISTSLRRPSSSSQH